MDGASSALRPFLPSLLFSRPDLAAHSQGEGIVLFVDVAGFTALSETLAALGPEGAELLDSAIAGYFDGLLDRIEPFGGIPLKISGDALTCLFCGVGEPIARVAARAIACAQGLHRLGGGAEIVQTPLGQVRLAHKVGIGAGRFVCGIIGQGAHREFAFAGEALNRAVAAEKVSSPGMVYASPEVAHLFPEPSLWGPRHPSGMSCLLPVDRHTPSLGAALRAVLPEGAMPPMELAPAAVREAAERGTLAYISRHQSLTILFAAFAGIAYDGPASIEALDRHYCAMSAVVREFGGFLSEFEAGDKGSKFILLFGAPQIVEDAPGRAVRCAWRMQEVARELGSVTEQRIGMSTGRLYVGRIGCGRIAKYSALGDRMNLAARLMSGSPEWTVLAEEATIQRSGRHGRWGEMAQRLVKGKAESITVAALAGLCSREEAERRGRTLIGREGAQKVGRGFIAQLAEGRGGILLLRGPAGIGKTALVDVIEREARGRNIRGLGWSDGTLRQHARPLAAWRSVVRDLVGMPQDARPKAAQVFFQTWLEALGPNLSREGRRLAPILGLEALDDPILESLPEDQRIRLRGQALADCLLARPMGPRLLILDGADVLDEPSFVALKILAGELESIALGVMIAVRGTDNGWRGRLSQLSELPGVVDLPIQPLTNKEVADLARERLGATYLDQELESLLERRGAGNPLRVESWVGLLQERAQVRVQDGEAFLRNAVDLDSLPDRLESLVLARVDSLPTEARLTLGVASIIGLSFRPEEVQVLHPEGLSLEEVRAHLRLGARGAIVYTQRGDPGRMYFVRQEVFNAIHDSLSYQLRRAFHTRRAELLILESGGVPEGEAIFALARHYAYIDEPATQVHYFRQAAHLSRERHDQRSLIRWTRREIDILTRVGPSWGLVDALDRLQNALALLGEGELRSQELKRLIEVAQENGDIEAEIRARVARARVSLRTGQRESALEELDSALEAAKAVGDTGLMIEVICGIGSAYAEAGQYQRALTSIDGALARGLTEDPVLLAHLRFARGNALSGMGRPGEAYDAFLEAAPHLRGLNPNLEAALEGNLSVELFSLGRLDQGLTNLRRALTLKRRIGDRREEAISLMNIGYASYVIGDLRGSREACEEALRLCRRLRFRRGETISLGNLGECLWVAGQLPEAGEAYRAVEVLLADHPEDLTSRGELLVRQGELALTLGDLPGARGFFEEGLGLLEGSPAGGLELNAREGLAEALLRDNHLHLAAEMIDAALRAFPTQGEGLPFPQRLFYRGGRVLEALGEVGEARARYEEARRLLIERVVQLSQRVSRARLLNAFPWNRAIHGRAPFDILALEGPAQSGEAGVGPGAGAGEGAGPGAGGGEGEER